MKTFQQLQEELKEILPHLDEAIHDELKGVLNDENSPSREKLGKFLKTTRNLLAKGTETGLQDSKPKKGSSRAVFFSKEHAPVTIDGHETSMPTVHKIAFPGALDKYRPGKPLLGEMQNRFEADHFFQQHHAMLSPTYKKGHFETNPRGVLAPVIDHHEDHHHLEMGRIEPLTAKNLAETTKNQDFPKGLKLKHIQEATQHEYDQAYGRGYGSDISPEAEEAKKHPFVENLIDYIHSSGSHPGDYNARNMGIWTHPVTGTRHPVISDYGFNKEIGEEYNVARKASLRSKGFNVDHKSDYKRESVPWMLRAK